MSAVQVQAQNDDQGGNNGTSYRLGEKTPVVLDQTGGPSPGGGAQKPTPPEDPKTQGPVRMARFAFVKGNVTWRADDGMEWSKATVNLPIRQGAQVWVTDGGRAAVQFDDGSELRLGNGALATLKVLYSDAKGEFSQITLTAGLATLYSRRDVSVYQVDTPLVSVKTTGATQIRFGVDSGSEVAVQRGSASVEGVQGKSTLHQGMYVDLMNADSPLKPMPAPGGDTWDRWNADRNKSIETKSAAQSHLPPNIAMVAGDLDSYGTWHDDPKYGEVWAPHETSPDWRPYYDGNWTWVPPYGWTWVGNEPWGWAPYHYGSWINEPYGWAWCPGPAYQYWSPGVVAFSVYGGGIGWAPLCPFEVVYPPAFGLGFWGNNWFFSFSIGFAGCYYPWGGGFWRPWGNYFVNHWGPGGPGYGHFGAGRPGAGYGGVVSPRGYVPYNASHAAGATVASTQAFGGRGTYQAVPRGQTAMFSHGQTVGAPAAGRSPTSGPATVQPTRQSMTPTRSFVSNSHPSQAVLQRSTYSASLPRSVERSQYGTSVTRNAADAASQARATLSSVGSRSQTTEARTASSASPSRSTGGQSESSSAAEAARQARASIGYTGRSAGSSSASYGQRSGGSYGNSMRSGGYSGAGSRGYESGGGYHVNEGYSGSRGGGSSAGGGGGSRGGGGRGR